MKLFVFIFYITAAFSSGISFAKSNIQMSLPATVFRSSKELLASLPEDMPLGNSKAKVRVIIFDSYSCIHCANFYREIFPELEKKYIQTNKVYFIHKEFPLDKTAFFATKVVRCSKNKLGKILEIYHSQQEILSGNYEEKLLKTNGVDSSCVKNFDEQKALKQGFEYSKVLQIVGTPTVYVNGVKVEKVQKRSLFDAIDKALTLQLQ